VYSGSNSFCSEVFSNFAGLTPYIQLSYEWGKSDVSQQVVTPSDLFEESYDETLVTRYLGAGIKYKQKNFLAAK
jgi:hypothetical protein